MLTTETVNEDIGASQNFIFHIDFGGFIIVVVQQSGDFSAAGLDHVVEPVAAGLHSCGIKLDSFLVVLLVSDGHHQINYIMVNSYVPNQSK